jgi:hypothetical protein
MRAFGPQQRNDIDRISESWQRDDTEDHTFDTDYPIGANVELMSVRVLDLK